MAFFTVGAVQGVLVEVAVEVRCTYPGPPHDSAEARQRAHFQAFLDSIVLRMDGYVAEALRRHVDRALLNKARKQGE